MNREDIKQYLTELGTEIVNDHFDSWAKELFEKAGGRRELASIACGYYPPWKVAELYSTHGLHPMEITAFAHSKGLRMAWNSIQDELVYTAGMAASAAASMVRECRAFDRNTV